MYRIAVIQNEVEMQHSGYVDAVPKYKKKGLLKHLEIVFCRFSSVNIGQLFNVGENYILDFDCIIIGTNATSDDDVYKVLLEPQNKNLLAEYLSKGKGLLICSQKKFNKVTTTNEEDSSLRKTFFMPSSYEYMVRSRPQIENSSDGEVSLYNEGKADMLNTIQQFLLTYPIIIKEKTIKKHCCENDFQVHYYRDYIEPANSSHYFPVLVDNSRGKLRNLLMVAMPRKKEKIVVSTMALDWAGHYEMIENILYYLLFGIPSVAIIKKAGYDNSELKALVGEAELQKLSYRVYNSWDKVGDEKLQAYHSVYVFAPEYDEREVLEYWHSFNPRLGNDSIKHKFLYYRKNGSDIILECLSNFWYFDSQKEDICAWLRSEYKDGFWGNSFWKTHDALFGLHQIGETIKPFLKNTFEQIRKHYKSGSYDGVLAPTCGLFELESLVLGNQSFKIEVPDVQKMFSETKQWLVDKFKETSNHYNKKFIIRSFYSSGYFDDLRKECDFSGREIRSMMSVPSQADESEIDLCLDIEVYLNYINDIEEEDRRDYDEKIVNYIKQIIAGQLKHNGKWDNNLGKTARIIVFLQKIKNRFANMTDFVKDDVENEISKAIDAGIVALKRAYKNGNWENNVVTTANAITALKEVAQNNNFALHDLAKQIGHESAMMDSYASLRLALDTIDGLNKKNGDIKEKEKALDSENKKIKDKISKLETEKTEKKKERVRLYSVIVFLVLLLLSWVLYVGIKHKEAFTDFMSETLLWIPMVLGVLLTSLIKHPLDYLQYIKKIFKKKQTE